MKINTKAILTNFEGKPLLNEDKTEVTVGEALSSVLINAKHGGKMKIFVLAEKIYKEPEVEVDTADLSLIKDACEKSEIFTVLVLGQLLKILESIKA